MRESDRDARALEVARVRVARDPHPPRHHRFVEVPRGSQDIADAVEHVRRPRALVWPQRHVLETLERVRTAGAIVRAAIAIPVVAREQDSEVLQRLAPQRVRAGRRLMLDQRDEAFERAVDVPGAEVRERELVERTAIARMSPVCDHVPVGAHRLGELVCVEVALADPKPHLEGS